MVNIGKPQSRISKLKFFNQKRLLLRFQKSVLCRWHSFDFRPANLLHTRNGFRQINVTLLLTYKLFIIILYDFVSDWFIGDCLYKRNILKMKKTYSLQFSKLYYFPSLEMQRCWRSFLFLVVLVVENSKTDICRLMTVIWRDSCFRRSRKRWDADD